jgi:hypothetical protein
MILINIRLDRLLALEGKVNDIRPGKVNDITTNKIGKLISSAHQNIYIYIYIYIYIWP